MKKDLFLTTGNFTCCLLIMFIFLSCKKENKLGDNVTKVVNKYKKTVIKKDSIPITIILPKKSTTGFNIKDNYYQNYFLEFSNKSLKDSTVLKKIPRIHRNEVISFRGGYFDKEGIKSYSHYYLTLNDSVRIDFKYVKGNLELIKSNGIINIDDLYKDYQKMDSKIFGKKKEILRTELKGELDSIYKKYKTKYVDSKYQKLLNRFNTVKYLANLQGIYPNDLKVKDYILRTMHPIACSAHSGLLYTYVKNRVETFQFDSLINGYSKEFVENFSIGLFNFLKYEDNKGDKKYHSAVNWLKTTDLYKKDSIYIRKEITPLNNIIFKKKLENIELQDVEGRNLPFSKIIRQNPSDYYLIDLWATWCAPCIEGVRLMKKMDIPKNVSIISLSLDQSKDKQEWRNITKKLEQKISYLVKDKNVKNQEFLKFIELQSVPRYMLIDKNLNLIDEAFLHPHEPQFLSKLKDVKYAKYW